MRSITDRNGMSWEVIQRTAGRIGARAEFQPLPEPTFGTIEFKSADGRKVTKKSPAGAIETMSDEALIGLLEKPTE